MIAFARLWAAWLLLRISRVAMTMAEKMLPAR